MWLWDHSQDIMEEGGVLFHSSHPSFRLDTVMVPVKGQMLTLPKIF